MAAFLLCGEVRALYSVSTTSFVTLLAKVHVSARKHIVKSPLLSNNRGMQSNGPNSVVQSMSGDP